MSGVVCQHFVPGVKRVALLGASSCGVARALACVWSDSPGK